MKTELSRATIAIAVCLICWSSPATQAADWQRGKGFRYLEVQPSPPAAANPPTAAGPRAGFTEMPASHTGVSFSNALSATLMIENQNYLLGSGVAAGDVDGDGICDLYFCAIAGTNALYHNRGNWQFERSPPESSAGGPGWHSTGATFADLDGDGHLDLLVATLGQGVHCFMNDGRGNFREATQERGLTTQTGSTSMALADVDGDGTLDLFVANYGALPLLRTGGRAQMQMVNGQWVVLGPYAQRLRYVNGQLEEVGEPSVLYLNDGNGHFRAVPWGADAFLDEEGKPKRAPEDFSLTVQMRDLNGDGLPDIYVCNDFQTVDRIWLNTGHGHFRALPRLAMRKQSFSAMGVDFADIDRDGFLDFIVTEMMAHDHTRRQRQVVGMRPDFETPGRFENRPEVPRNTLFHNRGDGTYEEIANYGGVAATDWTWQPAFLDVDLDGFEDLLIVNGTPYDVQDRDALRQVQSLGQQTPEAARTNLFLYPSFLTPHFAYRNQHDLTFADQSQAWHFDSSRIAQGLAFADLDNDGDLDVVLNCLNAQPLLYRNDAAAPRVAVRLRGDPPNTHGIGAMVKLFTGDLPVQMQEILCGGRYLSGDDTLRMFAAGALTNDLTIQVRWRDGRESVVTGVQPNRIYEVDTSQAKAPGSGAAAAAPSRAATSPSFRFQDVSAQLRHTHHEELFNDFTRQPLIMKLLSQSGPGVAWVDLEGTGRDDLIVGTGKGGAPGLDRRLPTGAFQPAAFPPTNPAPDDLTGLTAWTWADGRSSVLAGLANYESGQTNGPAVVELTWSGAGAAPTVKALEGVLIPGVSVGPLAAADLDGDGSLELFVGGRVIPGAYPVPAASLVFRQQQGRLVVDEPNRRPLAGAGLVSGAVWSDLDGDGFPELVLACEWGPIRVFQNDRGKLREETAKVGLAAFTGWWNGVTTGDLDEDGRPDILASNWGLNTGYEASPEHPLELYYGDVRSAGTVDLIEAYYVPELQAMAPRRALSALVQAFPFLADVYPTHRDFSTTTMPALLRTLPAQPQVVRASTLATTLFLNRGTNFSPVPLPAPAQFAPAFAVLVADADGDGHEDVFLSQNFFDVRPEWPRLDAGRALWLRGDGTGRLVPVPGQDSGVMVYGEQRGAAVGDYNADGRVDLVVSQNGAATQLYENIGARPGLRVRLRGPQGNPHGIGATLQLEAGQKWGPARELHGGSGYWSQDSLVQVLASPAAPTRLRVRWPGGKTTITPVPPGVRELEVDQDGNGTSGERQARR